jgi:hypothetical protein
MNRRGAALSVIVLLSLGLTTTADPQTKPNTASPAKKSLPVPVKTIPTIKCSDAESMTACKSFKQLVVAGDKPIIDIITGTRSAPAKPSGYRKHVAYVCPRKDLDDFWTVDFDLPKGESYEPYSFYLTEEAVKRSNEQLAFLGPSTPNHPVDPSIQDQWYEEHLDGEIYDFGTVGTHEYTDGLPSEWEYDFGKWSRPSETQDDPASDDKATFEGAYVWLERHTGNEKDSPDIGDDPEHAHISIADGNIHIHYLFETKTGAHIDNELNIQESTGRFTQTFIVREAPSLGNVESTGACMIFKQ